MLLSLCREAGRSSSFGEMLFLIAIHFHGNHMHAIAELVCSTLGMKVEYLCLHYLFLILLSILLRLSYLSMIYLQFCIT